MAHYLGTPYKRGHSDVIQAYDRPTTDIEEGLAVVEKSGTTIEKATGSNGVIVGVMGGTEHKGASAVICGAEVAVQLDAGVSTIATTESVYVTPDGKFSNTDNSGANKQVNATWVDGVVHSDGVVSVGSSKRTNQKCALISFRGGL